MSDVYTEKTLELMNQFNFDQYLKLMADSAIPKKNKITLVYLKIKDFEEEAKKIIMQEAMDRKADQERRRLADV